MKKRKNKSMEIGVLTVSEAIELLQSLPDRYGHWPIYCCGSSDVFLNIDEVERSIIFDEDNLFEEDVDI